MPVQKLASIKFNHEELGFCKKSNILYCFIWKNSKGVKLYVGRNGTSNKTGKSSAFKRLGRHLSNHDGKSKTQSIFKKYPELRYQDFEIKIVRIHKQSLKFIEPDVIECLFEKKYSKNELSNEIIKIFLGRISKKNVEILNGRKIKKAS